MAEVGVCDNILGEMLHSKVLSRYSSSDCNFRKKLC